MRISFESEEIREICEKKAVAEKKLGAKTSKKLQTRISEILVSNNFIDGIINNYIQEEPDGRSYSLDLGNFKLIFQPINKPPRYDEKGNLRKELVTRVKFISINKVS